MAENWLSEYGFTAVQLPRRDLQPGDVLLRENGQYDQKAGNLGMLFGSAQALPTTPGEPVANIGRTISKKVDLGFGLKILDALFGAGVSSQLGGEASLRRARTLAVTYEDVRQDSLALLELQSWLEQAQVKASSQAMVWLNEERFAAVTAVLRTAQLSIVAESADGASIELAVPEIQGIVAGNATVSAASSSSSRISFTGREPIAFGFQAYVMKFRGNVSFGLKRTRGLRPSDHRSQAWTSPVAVEEITDA